MARISTMVASVKERPLHIGYRAWRAQPWLGRHGQLKGEHQTKLEFPRSEHGSEHAGHCALDQCSDGGAAKTKNEITLPVSWHCTVGDFYRPLTNHDLGRYEVLTCPTGARSRHSEHARHSWPVRVL
jgi:hypothetical protein